MAASKPSKWTQNQLSNVSASENAACLSSELRTFPGCASELRLCIQLTEHQEPRSTHLLITHGHGPAAPTSGMPAGYCAKELAPVS